LNERVIFRFSTDAGSCVVVMVAGWGVGNITLPFATNARSRREHGRVSCQGLPRSVKQGDWIATFELGSSVVLITSRSEGATTLVSPCEKVHYGQPIARFAPNDSFVHSTPGGDR
jgi:phosphatidylserine decarboxylase